ncbi:MAG TPA: hypothetical protein VM186_12805, partial [Planctomycetota bacterium]|nr:hypothetical protein [Planctomycetota bacterium]
MRSSQGTMRVWLAAVIAGSAALTFAELVPDPARSIPHGRLELLNSCRVLSVDGTPEQIGTACGILLKDT